MRCSGFSLWYTVWVNIYLDVRGSQQVLFIGLQATCKSALLGWNPLQFAIAIDQLMNERVQFCAVYMGCTSLYVRICIHIQPIDM